MTAPTSLSDLDSLPDNASAPPQLLERLMAISRASALEEMASGIAHELNQPLGAIVTFAQAGERILNGADASAASAREVFQLISKEALGAAEGIRRMRRLFHRDALDKTACGIDEVVSELFPVLELLASQAGVQLLLEQQPRLPKVSVDRLRVQHVLFTLAQNAIEASQLGDAPPRVRIAASGDRYGIEVSISDTGPGIALAERPQIFHPFFTTKPQGTGLGLASARAIIEAHEGSIGFEALGEAGTRFWFRVPACEQQ
jgi:signal transduction histidine kinase